jgi:hypothetical protein
MVALKLSSENHPVGDFVTVAQGFKKSAEQEIA